MIAIKELGASLMQIVGKLNTVVIVAFSVAFLGESLPGEVALCTDPCMPLRANGRGTAAYGMACMGPRTREPPI
jgi:hypothetical protein